MKSSKYFLLAYFFFFSIRFCFIVDFQSKRTYLHCLLKRNHLQQFLSHKNKALYMNRKKKIKLQITPITFSFLLDKNSKFYFIKISNFYILFLVNLLIWKEDIWIFSIIVFAFLLARLLNEMMRFHCIYSRSEKLKNVSRFGCCLWLSFHTENVSDC